MHGEAYLIYFPHWKKWMEVPRGMRAEELLSFVYICLAFIDKNIAKKDRAEIVNRS